MLKIFLVLQVCLTFVFSSAHAYDVIPSSGETAIYVEPTVLNNVPGANIQECNFRYDLRDKKYTYTNCKPLTQRVFYSKSEIETVVSRLKKDRIVVTGFGMGAGGVVGAGAGFLALIVTGGTVAPVILLYGLIATGASIGTYKGYTESNAAISPVQQGVRDDKNVILDKATYEKAVHELRYELSILG